MAALRHTTSRLSHLRSPSPHLSHLAKSVLGRLAHELSLLSIHSCAGFGYPSKRRSQRFCGLSERVDLLLEVACAHTTHDTTCRVRLDSPVGGKTGCGQVCGNRNEDESAGMRSGYSRYSNYPHASGDNPVCHHA